MRFTVNEQLRQETEREFRAIDDTLDAVWFAVALQPSNIGEYLSGLFTFGPIRTTPRDFEN